MLTHALGQHELAVAARREQRQKGEGDACGLGRGQAGHEDVSLEVMHADKGLRVRVRELLGALGADAQADLETGTHRDTHRIDLRNRAHVRSFERLGDDAVEGVDVRVAREPRHDAAPLLVERGLRGKRLTEDGAVARHDRHSGVVAARLDAEDGERLVATTLGAKDFVRRQRSWTEDLGVGPQSSMPDSLRQANTFTTRRPPRRRTRGRLLGGSGTGGGSTPIVWQHRRRGAIVIIAIGRFVRMVLLHGEAARRLVWDGPAAKSWRHRARRRRRERDGGDRVEQQRGP